MDQEIAKQNGAELRKKLKILNNLLLLGTKKIIIVSAAADILEFVKDRRNNISVDPDTLKEINNSKGILSVIMTLCISILMNYAQECAPEAESDTDTGLTA